MQFLLFDVLCYRWLIDGATFVRYQVVSCKGCALGAVVMRIVNEMGTNTAVYV